SRTCARNRSTLVAATRHPRSLLASPHVTGGRGCCARAGSPASFRPAINRESTMTPSNTRRRSAAFALITASLLVPTKSHAQAGAPVGDAVFDSAWYARQAGAYIDALTILDRILGDPDPHRILEPAAE